MADHPLATLILGLLVAMLGVLIFVDREFALEIYWRGAPHRPSDRVILIIVRTFCMLLMAAGVIAWLLGLRSLLGRL